MKTYKKTLASLLVLATSVSFASAYTSGQLDGANTLASEGIINDHSTNPANYNLDQNVLRQEIAAVARGVAGLAKSNSCSGSFSDVSSSTPNTWACLSIEPLHDDGLIASNDTFRPEESITKAEGLGMLVKAACGDDYSYDSGAEGTWQEQVVKYASDNVIIDSFTDYDALATRGWVFEVGANAMSSCGDDQEAIDILEELLEGL